MDKNLTDEIKKQSLSLLGFKFDGIDYYDDNISTLHVNPMTISPSMITGLLKTPAVSQTKDDDGDNNFKLSVKTQLSTDFYDNLGNKISDKTKTFCDIANNHPSPYKLKISGDLTLTTQYGVPNSKEYNISTTETLIQPSKEYLLPVTNQICYLKPNLNDNTNAWLDLGASSMWDPDRGFLVQSTNPSSYNKNFPTTGSNRLFFDISFITDKPLTWSNVSVGGITAKVSNITNNSVRITLDGPYASVSQSDSNNPSPVAKPSLPAVFELEGKDSKNNTVIKYGFSLKQWFIHRYRWAIVGTQRNWCTQTGYYVPDVKDLTNAQGTSKDATDNNQIPSPPPIPTFPDQASASTANFYRRHIGAGLFTEWGSMGIYNDQGIIKDGNYYDPNNIDWRSYVGYWTNYDANTYHYHVDGGNGMVFANPWDGGHYISCKSN